jgi:hypothetical protein
MRNKLIINDLGTGKTPVGYIGGRSERALIGDGDRLIIFETLDVLAFHCEKQKVPPCVYTEEMYFEDVVEGLRHGREYCLTRGAYRVFDVLWRTRIGVSPFGRSIHELTTDFYQLSLPLDF